MSRDPVTVLIIEDNEEYAKCLEVQLDTSEFFKYQCHKVQTFAAARQFLRGVLPEAIILDLTLPNGVGVQLVEEVRKLAPRKLCGLIVVTGMTEREIEIQAMWSLADDFIVKTRETTREFVRSMDKIVQRSRAKRRLPLETADEMQELVQEMRENPLIAPFPETVEKK